MRHASAAADQAQARGEPLGLLHGLPVAHKDSFLTAGMRTTHGSPVFADFVPERSSLVVTRQQAA
ncbi:amidase family protein, partial [Bordetella pertussis]|uniref:amidase family protein n=1 Tax=Bordetella pertussis TaxID=520 RepID=UPI001FEF2B56